MILTGSNLLRNRRTFGCFIYDSRIFSSIIMDERSIAIAENTALSLTNFIIEKYGVDAFIKDEDMTKYRNGG